MKTLADQHKHALGFVRRGALEKAVERHELYVAESGDTLAGFAYVWRRRDGQVTLHAIAVDSAYRLRGIGKALVERIRTDTNADGTILARCPVDLEANRWYAALEFEGGEMEKGKARHLNIWRLAAPLQKGDGPA